MMYFDVDDDMLGDPGPWDLQLLTHYHGLSRHLGVEPRVSVSCGGRGVHMAFPGVTLSPEDDQRCRDIWDCPGHAEFTRLRGGADILFSRRGSATTTPCRDIWEAIDIIRRNRT